MHNFPEIFENKRFIIFGSNGQLGKMFASIFRANSIEYIAYDIEDVDISDYSSLSQLLNSIRADYVINCAAYNLVDNAELNRDLAYMTNTIGPKNISQLSLDYDFKAIHFSTDYVFSGIKNNFYNESDNAEPINFYGETKLQGEKFFLGAASDALLFRTSWVYGEGKQNFIHKLIEWSDKQDTIKVTMDEVSIPTSVNIIAETALKAISQNLKGLYHLTASGYATRYEWAKEVFKLLNKEVILLPVASSEFNLLARRPYFSALSNKKLAKTLKNQFPSWQEDLAEFINNSNYFRQFITNK